MSREDQNHSHNPKPAPRPNGRQSQIGLRARERTTGEGEANVDFSEIWDTIREGKWIILLTCIIITGGIAAYTMTLPPVYEAESIVSVEGQGEQAVDMMGFGQDSDLDREIGLLRNSAQLSERVAERLRETAETQSGEFPILTGEEGEPLSTVELGEQILEQVSFTGSSDQGIITITVESQGPEEAAAIANLYAEEYQQFSVEQSRAGVVAAREFLEEQVERREREIEELEQQWEQFALQHDVVIEGEGGERIANRYTDLEGERTQLEFELAQEQRSLEVVERQLDQFEPELRSRVLEEEDVTQIQSSIGAINEEIAQLRVEAISWYSNNPDLEGNEEQEPELARIVDRIERFEEQRDQLLDEMVGRAADREASIMQGGALDRVAELRNQALEHEMRINELEAQIEAIDSELDTYEGDLDDLPRQQIEHRRLEERLALQEDFYADVVSELQRTIMREESELGYVRPVRSAIVPSTPVSPNLQQNIILGLLLGLGFGIGLAFIRRAITSRLRTPKDIQSTGYNVVGVIPQMDQEVKSLFDGRKTIDVGERQLSTQLLPLLNPWSPIAENYRLVRTNLQHASTGVAPETILITSSEQGDGKTLTAVNVAITMAQGGRRTLLIDADLRRPNAHNLLGMSHAPGVADILETEGTVSDHIQPTEVDGLHFLAAGEIDKPPAESLGSERMEQLVDYYRDQYDVVIIDSPPVLAVTDPILLSRYCDATLLVVAANRTDIEAIQTSEQTLEAVGEPVSGVIFNRFDERKGSRYDYGYDYDYAKYGYSSYGQPEITS